MKVTMKLISLLLCLVMLAAFAACGSTTKSNLKVENENSQSASDKDNTSSKDNTASDKDNTASDKDNTASDKGDNTAPESETPDNTEDDAPQNNTSEEGTNAPVILPEINSVPASSSVKKSYFDDVAFVGDSVSLKLSYYASSTGKLGGAQFFTAGSLGSANALWEVSDESVHPYYLGVKTLVEDCIQQSGVKKVYIMLGMNDIGLYGIDDTVKNFETLIGKILQKSPNVQIIVQSMTPMTSTSTILGSSLNNTSIKEYNVKLSQLCEKKGWSFVDVASVMYDAQGNNLNRSYCSDPDGLGVHFTEAGCEAWINYLYTHTP